MHLRLNTTAKTLSSCYLYRRTFPRAFKAMANENSKAAFWDATFIEKKEFFGFEPSPSTVIVKDFFSEHSVKSVLVPGIGYGRNAKAFSDVGMKVTGIEISQAAIEMARKHYGNDMRIHLGSITDMPFDDTIYDGVYSYATIHLLDTEERAKFIRDCYNQLKYGGYMTFVAVTKSAQMYGNGVMVGKDRYDNHNGAPIFFYDRESIEEEFGAFGLLVDIREIQEHLPFYIITCKK